MLTDLPWPLPVVRDAAPDDPLLPDEPAAADVLVVRVGAERVEVPLALGARVEAEGVALDRRHDVLAVLAHEAVAVLAAVRAPAPVRRQLAKEQAKGNGLRNPQNPSVLAYLIPVEP